MADLIEECGAHFQALSRRGFLMGAGALASGLALPAWAQEATPSQAADFWLVPRTLRLQHISGEKIEATYWSDGQYIADEYSRLSWFLRDRVVNEGIYMNPVILDIAYAVGGWLAYFGLREYMVITSAHRNRRRNAGIEGAAKDSLHVTGDALDVIIRGVSSRQLARFGIWLGGGGVGWYPGKGFTHLDRGRLRSWRG